MWKEVGISAATTPATYSSSGRVTISPVVWTKTRMDRPEWGSPGAEDVSG